MKTLLNSISIDIITAIIISSVGGFANYLYKVSKGEKFSFYIMVINIFIGWFVGYIVQWFLDPSSILFWPLLAISGIWSHQIIRLIEDKIPDLISKFTK